jgi:hypothetical protein
MNQKTFLKHGMIITPLAEMKITSVTYNDKIPAAPLEEQPAEKPPIPNAKKGTLRIVPAK